MLSQFGRSQIVNAMANAGFGEYLVAQFILYVGKLPVFMTGPYSNQSGDKNRTSNNWNSKKQRPTDEVVVMDVDVNDDYEDQSQSKVISRDDVDYTHFLHVLMMLGRLSLYSSGRELFPVPFKHEGSVGAHHLSILTEINSTRQKGMQCYPLYLL
jgi:hypothetical protein